jgi:hypothetical protein
LSLQIVSFLHQGNQRAEAGLESVDLEFGGRGYGSGGAPPLLQGAPHGSRLVRALTFRPPPIYVKPADGAGPLEVVVIPPASVRGNAQGGTFAREAAALAAAAAALQPGPAVSPPPFGDKSSPPGPLERISSNVLRPSLQLDTRTHVSSSQPAAAAVAAAAAGASHQGPSSGTGVFPAASFHSPPSFTAAQQQQHSQSQPQPLPPPPQSSPPGPGPQHRRQGVIRLPEQAPADIDHASYANKVPGFIDKFVYYDPAAAPSTLKEVAKKYFKANTV